MFKKMLKGAVIGLAVMFVAGSAAAQPVEINFFGASAQFLYWNDVADNFLNSIGCASVTQVTNSKDHGATFTTAPCTDGKNYIIRYSADASYAGICSVKGIPVSQEPSCGAPCDGDPRKRLLCNEAANDKCVTKKCVDVTLGASDVAGSSFTQTSSGHKTGPLSRAPYVEGGRSFNGIDDSGLTAYNPLVVPFGFFANNGVTVTKCLGPDPQEGANLPANNHKAISKWGNQCYDPDNDKKSNDCIGYYKCIDKACAGGVSKGAFCDQVTDCPDVTLANTNCQPIPIDNVSRVMVGLIFSGNAYNWTDLGAWFPPGLPIQACMRHAGSGTQATFDWGLMRSTANDWGWTIWPAESLGDPTVYYNNGSSDMMACIQHAAGAIGFADCDNLAGTTSKTGLDFPYENIHEVKYNGVECRRWKIRNGHYDFYSVQWIYEDPAGPEFAATHDTVVALMNFAKDPDNLDLLPSKKDYWASKDEMVYIKPNDRLLPVYNLNYVPPALLP